MRRRSDHEPPVADRIGLAGLGVFALGLGIGGAPIRIGLALMLLACLLDWRRFWATVRHDPLAWAGGGLALYLCLLAGFRLAGAADADAVRDGLPDALVHTGLLALLVGWVMRGNPRRLLVIFALAGAGLLVALIRHGSPTEIAAYLDGARANFGLGGNGSGLYFGVALLGWFSLGLGGLARAPSSPVWRRLAWGAMFSLGAVLLVLPLVFNQSRASWLATLGLLPALVLGLRLAPSVPAWPRWVWVSALTALLLMGTTVQTLGDIVAQRIAEERTVVTRIAQGQTVAPESSAGIRVGLWRIALEAIQARPLLGHGPGAASGLIDAHPRLAEYPHFHNLYLQVWAETGAIGLVGAVLIYGLLARALLGLWRDKRAPGELTLFLIAAWAFYLAVSVFMIRHDDIHGVAFLGMLMGASYTFRLHRGVPPAATV
jgi:O-antigen ligase